MGETLQMADEKAPTPSPSRDFWLADRCKSCDGRSDPLSIRLPRLERIPVTAPHQCAGGKRADFHVAQHQALIGELEDAVWSEPVLPTREAGPLVGACLARLTAGNR